MVLKAAVAVTMLVLLPHGVTFPSCAWAPAPAACLTGQRHTRDKYSVGMCSPDGKVRPDAKDGSGQRSRVAPTGARTTRAAGSTTLLRHFLQEIEDAGVHGNDSELLPSLEEVLDNPADDMASDDAPILLSPPVLRTAALVNGSREGLQVAQHGGVIGKGRGNSLKAWNATGGQPTIAESGRSTSARKVTWRWKRRDGSVRTTWRRGEGGNADPGQARSASVAKARTAPDVVRARPEQPSAPKRRAETRVSACGGKSNSLDAVRDRQALIKAVGDVETTSTVGMMLNAILDAALVECEEFGRNEGAGGIW